MSETVRMSDLHDSDNEVTSPKAGVNALRARFEKRQSDNTKNANDNSAFRSPSPIRPLTPPGKRTQGPPPRPPPPKVLDKPKRHSDLYSEPHDAKEQARSVTPNAASPPFYSQQLEHPLTKSKSKSVGDLKAVKKELDTETVDGTAAVVESPVKKGKKGKNKAKSKDNFASDSPPNNSGGKKSWRKNRFSIDSDPKSSPDKPRNSSAPMLSKFSPHTSPKKEALAPTPESPPSSETGSSKEGTPTSARRKSASGGKKEAARRTESSQSEFGSGRENGKQKDIEKKQLRRIKTSAGVTSVYDNSRVRDDISSHPRSSPGIPKKGSGKEGGGVEVKQEAKYMKEAVLNAGWY